MARESITTGASGGSKRRAATHYGRRVNDTEHLAKLHLKHGEEVLEVTFRYDTLPGIGEDELILRIPQYAQIIGARLQVTGEFAGGTSLAVGLSTPDGVTEDADALIVDADAVLANLATLGNVVEGQGAAIGGEAITAENQVTVTATGDFTAGEATLTVLYRPLVDRADQFNDDL
ncbi:hypothetical protein NVP1209O_15 [Vibrio phage 1.209.O._10N.222.52.B2]|nr:hypothetical protein NVP1209O_15 [Vibrio phage 1.209.O._10N.222.52.B2]